jgi:putative phosphoribosyl transferase
MITTHATRRVTIPCAGQTLYGDLSWPIVPGRVHGLTVIAHASSGSRLNPRNQALAAAMNRAGLATLLIDLLGTDEDQWEASAVKARFDLDLLTTRLATVVDRLARLEVEVAALPVAVFGTGTAGSGAILAAGALRESTPVAPAPPRAGRIDAVVCRNGRPDLVADRLSAPPVPTLFLVGEHEPEAYERHRDAGVGRPGGAELMVIPGAADLVDAPVAVEATALAAAAWLVPRLDPGSEDDAGSH